MWVKICGNTNLEDAVLAAELGADAVGFVFAVSKRQVTAAQVGAITSHLPAGVERVGVFSSHDAEEIVRTATEAGLTTVQLHGGLDLRLLERLYERFAGRLGIIQTLHWNIDAPNGSPRQASIEATPHPSPSLLRIACQIKQLAEMRIIGRVLIDSKLGGADGGTGISFDWGAAHEVFANAPVGVWFILAGGLNSENVLHAVQLLAPWGVDVSSGVEALPGKKDPVLLARFIENARKAVRLDAG